LTGNIFEARTQLSKLIELAEKRQDAAIARAGKPVVRLTKLVPEKRPIRYGVLKGQIWNSDDLDAPLPNEVLKSLEG
jgi:antitoxin (DNA-binding transcriptional repressor) of toxin-antitoxin stability system